MEYIRRSLSAASIRRLEPVFEKHTELLEQPCLDDREAWYLIMNASSTVGLIRCHCQEFGCPESDPDSRRWRKAYERFLAASLPVERRVMSNGPIHCSWEQLTQ